MGTEEFLKLILPTEGNYVLFVVNGIRKWNENYTTIASAAEAVLRHDATESTVYFAVGSFVNNIESDVNGKQAVRRLSRFSHKFKAFACDLDVGDKYANGKEAAVDLLRACSEIGLPRPLLVRSGRGVHAYWPLTADIDSDRWQSIARMLRAALQDHNVDLDPSKIHEKAMVLRPVGAHHKKDADNPIKVAAAGSVEAVDITAIYNAVKAYELAAPPAKVNAFNSALNDGLSNTFAPIHLDSISGCEQIKALLASRGETDANGVLVSEPMWRASLGIAKFCDDPEDAVVRLAGGHPEFNLDDNLQKMAKYEGTGPTTCDKFNELCPGVCGTCPHFMRVKSPATLTVGASLIITEDEDTGEAVEIQLPKGYHIKQNALFYRDLIAEEDVFVAPYPIWIVTRVSNVDESQQHIEILVELPLEGRKIIDLPVNEVYKQGSSLAEALSNRSVYMHGDTSRLKKYLMAYLHVLQATTKTAYKYKYFGWQEDGTFLSGSAVHGRPDSPRVYLDGIADGWAPHFSKRGSAEVWAEATRVFDTPGLEVNRMGFLLMMGTLLNEGSGLHGATVSFYHKKSGSGKSLTGKFGLSAFGDPGGTQLSLRDTTNSFYKNVGTFRNFPIYCDEVTEDQQDKTKEVVMQMPVGMEKSRLGKDANSMRERLHWRTSLFLSTNKNLYDFLAMSLSAEAETLRLLQLQFDRSTYFQVNTEHGKAIDDLLRENYGHAGPMLAEELVNRGGHTKVYTEARAELTQKFNPRFDGPERYFEMMVICGYKCCQILAELNMIRFDYVTATRQLIDYICGEVRAERKGQTLDAIDTLFEFTTKHRDALVQARRRKTSDGYATQLVETPDRAVGRVDIDFKTGSDEVVAGAVCVNRTVLRNWCRANGADYRSIISGLSDLGAHCWEQRKSIFAGVPGAASTGQTYCLCVDVMSHPRLLQAVGGTPVAPVTSYAQTSSEQNSGSQNG